MRDSPEYCEAQRLSRRVGQRAWVPERQAVLARGGPHATHREDYWPASAAGSTYVDSSPMAREWKYTSDVPLRPSIQAVYSRPP